MLRKVVSLENIKRPLLSICIPSFGRVSMLRNTLESIYADLNGVELDDFEVIVSDNDPQMSLQCLSSEFNFPNFHYKSTTCSGFKNSLHALSFGRGSLLKLHNNTMEFKSGSLLKLIQDVRDNIDDMPLIFYTNGLKHNHTARRFPTFDAFIGELSYFSSWSNGFCVWNDDFTFDVTHEVDEFFPQTSILLSQYLKSGFIVSDFPYFKMQSVKGKGGYNVFEVFCEHYIGLLESASSDNKITLKTLNRVRRDMLFVFFPLNFFKTKIIRIERYATDSLKDSLDSRYPWYGYYIVIILGSFFLPYYLFDSVKRFLLNFGSK